MLAAVLAAALAQPLAFSVRIEPARPAAGDPIRAVVTWKAAKEAPIRLNRRGLYGQEVHFELIGEKPVALRKPESARPLLDADFLALAAGEAAEYAYPLSDLMEIPVLKPGRYKLKARYRSADARGWTGELAAETVFRVAAPKL